MKKFLARSGSAFALLAAIAVLASGCGKTGQPVGETKGSEKEKVVAQNTGDKKGTGSIEDTGDHSGWWCPEHGLPEHVCDLCSRKYREAEKAKGNWCEHSRVKTSCFKCNPGLKEKYAAEYKAKFSKDPPPTEDEEEKKDEGKKDKK